MSEERGEKILKSISEGSWYAIKTIFVIFLICGIIINVFLGLIIIAKLYGAEIALSLTNIIKILFNGMMWMTFIAAIVGIFAEVIISLKKSKEKCVKRKKSEFEGFVKSIINKNKSVRKK